MSHEITLCEEEISDVSLARFAGGRGRLTLTVTNKRLPLDHHGGTMNTCCGFGEKSEAIGHVARPAFRGAHLRASTPNGFRPLVEDCSLRTTVGKHWLWFQTKGLAR
jgi:hypothetical protein